MQCNGIHSSHTQKSMSRLPALPNSLSPTWKVTVMTSSLWSSSWKHSRPWAGSCILWPSTACNRPAAANNMVVEKNMLPSKQQYLEDRELRRVCSVAVPVGVGHVRGMVDNSANKCSVGYSQAQTKQQELTLWRLLLQTARWALKLGTA
jgi:hypothetical protein